MLYINEEKNFFSATKVLQKKNHSKLSKNEPVCIWKEGWCFRLGQAGGYLGEGGRGGGGLHEIS